MNDIAIGLIRKHAEFLVLEAEWRALEPQMVPLPFVSFDWAAAWWEHLRSDRAAIRDELCVFTFRRADGSLCGVAPMMVSCRPNLGSLSLRQLQFIGADTNITELRCLAAPIDEMSNLYSALIEHLRTQPVDFDWLKLTGLPAQSGLFEKAENDLGQARWTRDVPNFYLTMAPTWAEFKSGLSRNIKESLRKCYNAPKRDGLEFTFHIVSQQDQLQAAVKDFVRLHGMRAQLSDTIAHPDVFRSESSRAFLFDVCRRFAQRGQLRVFQLKHCDAVIASRIGFAFGDSLYLYYSGYDPAYAKYSVMTTTVAEAIQYAIVQGFHTVNLSTGRDVSKERWGPAELTYRELEVTSKSSLCKMKYQIFKAASGGVKNTKVGRLMGRMIARNVG